MASLVFDKQHIRDYFVCGIIAAAVYTAPLLFLLRQRMYENLYYLYFGNFLFMLTIGIYAGMIRHRQYEKKRTVSMMIAGHLATVTGIVFACAFSLLAIKLAAPVFRDLPLTDGMVQDRSPELYNGYRHLSWMVIINAMIANAVVGSFISLMISYGMKKEE
jgi:hypothetical protein